MFIFKSKPKNPLDNEEIRLLFANMDLILANADKILQNEKYKNIGVKGSGIDGIYIGHVNLFLGDLISLWSNGSPWRNGQKFYYHLGGSPLSGMSFCTYWENGKIGCDRGDRAAPSFGTLLKPAGVVINNNTEQDNCISVPFPKRLVSEMKIGDLINQLRTDEKMKDMNKYDKMWQEGKMPMQQLAKELIEKGNISADLDYKSHEAVQLAIKYNQEQKENKKDNSEEAIKELEEKRKTLPPLETWLDSDKTMRELHEMGYSYLEMIELLSRLR